MVATVIPTPFDVIKTRIQTLPTTGTEPYGTSVIATGKRIIATEGYRHS